MRLRSKLILLLAFVTAGSVLGYNAWLYSCGACTLRALITPSMPGYLLLALNLLLLATLALLKRRQTRRAAQRFCRCGCELLPHWGYCPDCGSQRVS
ncbi:MAG TPA: hypothetical protein VJ995_06440 [Geothermobacteraceae bacterium]|nr:hypothetical protein [Geothermobacteraceae bacterium]